MSGTAFKDIQEDPGVMPVLLKCAERRVDRMLRQNAIRSLVIEDSMAAPQLREECAHAVLKLLRVCAKQSGRPLIDELHPRVVVNACDVDVVFENALFNGCE